MIERRFHKKMNKELNADFSDLLEEKEIKTEPTFDFAEELKKDYKIFTNYGYYNGKIILAKYEQYIACLGSKKTILLINTDYPNLEHHSHLRLRTNKSGEIVLSTVDYIFNCIRKKQYPKSNYTFICTLRLLPDDDPYKKWLLFKKEKDKNKQKYLNTHKKNK